MRTVDMVLTESNPYEELRTIVTEPVRWRLGDVI